MSRGYTYIRTPAGNTAFVRTQSEPTEREHAAIISLIDGAASLLYGSRARVRIAASSRSLKLMADTDPANLADEPPGEAL